jgi:hypothetical protein
MIIWRIDFTKALEDALSAKWKIKTMNMDGTNL